jgi:ribosomal protein L11 methyltransferase
MQKIWALTLEVPFSAVEAIVPEMPSPALGESAFIKDQDDRSADPLWLVQGFYKEKPELTDIEVAAQVLQSAHGHKPYAFNLEQVATTGWIEKNQQRYAPIHIGRFVIHDPSRRAEIPFHKKGIEMEVSCAFGTGEHPTTFGCLTALQTLPRMKRGARVLDLGSGTGVLAIAAALHSPVTAIASDMDGPSVKVCAENMLRNRLAKRIRSVHADGFRSRLIRRGKPYDLILSNIFARPLARFAPVMTSHLKPGGHIILAGFLRRDEVMVRNAYMREKAFVKRTLRFGAWSVLILKKRAGKRSG